MAAQSSEVKDNGLFSPVPSYAGGSSKFACRTRCTPNESRPSFLAISGSVKGFVNRFNASETSSAEKKTPARWGQRAGVGVLPEGGPEEIQFRLVRHHSFLGGQHANPLQFFVGEKALFDMAGALHMADSRFPGNSSNFRHGKSQKVCRSRLGDVLRYLIIHFLFSPHAGISAIPAFSTVRIIAL